MSGNGEANFDVIGNLANLNCFIIIEKILQHAG